MNMKYKSKPIVIDITDTSTIDNGSTCAYLFISIKTLVTNVYGMKSNK